MADSTTEVLGGIVLFNQNPNKEGRGEVYTGFWWGNLRESDHLEDLGLNGRVIQGVPILIVKKTKV
jgi:hypothetical protein